MCGISGYAGQSGTTEKLQAMAGALRRRGPDDQGFYEEKNIGLGFRRLSIIDLSTGHQPMTNENGSVWVIFNGEIYDFQKIREELVTLGHVFKTTSDTEVIVHAYDEWKDDCFEKLNGMFAIAIWDSKKSKLLLARDRLGKKPLYWTIQNDTLWFASELKSMLSANIFEKKIDMDSLALYFRTDYIPTPKTIFENVYKLEPATILTWENRMVSKKRFWEYPIEKIDASSKEDIVRELGKRIDKAVKDRLISDVPLGLFLSGGLDSAVVAESASRQNPGLQAFTLGFEDSSYDETAGAKIVAEKFGLRHHIEMLSEEKVLGTLDEAVELLDEPLADPSILPQLLLSKFTHQNVTVALSGDGGDELLLGYQHIPAHIWTERLSFLPTQVFNRVADIVGRIPSGSGYFSFGFKAQRLSRGLSMRDKSERDIAWRGAFDKKGLKKLIHPEILNQIDLDNPMKIMTGYIEESPNKNSWSAWSWSYLRTFLMDDVLVKVDRATMWNSLEARAPLLDVSVVSYLLNIPDKYKLGTFKGKGLFKELLGGKLPSSVLESPKHGFGVPTAKWLNGSLRKKLLEVSDPQFLSDQKLFNSEYITQITKEHHIGTRDKRKELWAFLMFQLWYIKWIKP